MLLIFNLGLYHCLTSCLYHIFDISAMWATWRDFRGWYTFVEKVRSVGSSPTWQVVAEREKWGSGFDRYYFPSPSFSIFGTLLDQVLQSHGSTHLIKLGAETKKLSDQVQMLWVAGTRRSKDSARARIFWECLSWRIRIMGYSTSKLSQTREASIKALSLSVLKILEGSAAPPLTNTALNSQQIMLSISISLLLKIHAICVRR